MSAFLESLPAGVRNECEAFIRDIKSGRHHRRSLPNSFADFPSQKALESFEALLASGDMQSAVERAYDKSSDEP
jgi:hypothetical protein